MIGAAVKVMQIATGEIEEDISDDGKSKAAVELGRKGGKARAQVLSPKRRKEIAKNAAKARWKDPADAEPLAPLSRDVRDQEEIP